MCSWVYCLYPRNPIICQAELILKYPQLFRFFLAIIIYLILAIPFKLQVVPYPRACKFENMTVYIAKWLLNIWYEFINEHDLVGIECQSCSVAIWGTGFCQILCKLLRFKPNSPSLIPLCMCTALNGAAQQRTRTCLYEIQPDSPYSLLLPNFFYVHYLSLVFRENCSDFFLCHFFSNWPFRYGVIAEIQAHQEKLKAQSYFILPLLWC